MIATVQSDAFNGLIRRLENRPDLHDDTLRLKFKQYTDRLWGMLEPYGVTYEGVVGTGGSLASIQFLLHGHPSQVETILQGVALVEPISVQVQFRDLDVLVGSQVGRALLQENWPAIQHDLTNIDLPGLRDRIENIAMKLMNGTVSSGVANQFSFEEWCNINGIREPGGARRKAEEVQEAADKAAANRRSYEAEQWRERDGNDASSWHVKL